MSIALAIDSFVGKTNLQNTQLQSNATRNTHNSSAMNAPMHKHTKTIEFNNAHIYYICDINCAHFSFNSMAPIINLMPHKTAQLCGFVCACLKLSARIDIKRRESIVEFGSLIL